ncbi:SDR family NAD(P)-dependent oxidoreductase [Paenibacillus xylaniclasticus]|uniref:SDR family NAD(P)-dependent oxidoreductase n=1 Tax=Paenibacillus xylaniclasticus TaxID=588083 RepID=UPI0013DF6D48|nr:MULTISPECIES: SDR family NAD(P)-dependent oxidoreductase [Paenibacillus]GFN33012.1 hypothetical protein PCURB6_32720 [Paenibacillus curdlanolyticus]
MDFGTVRLQSMEMVKRAAPAVKPATDSDIAIVGIGMRLPYANSESELLQLLRVGKDAIRKLPNSRRIDTDRYFRTVGVDPSTLHYGEAAFLEHIDRFDYSFFKLSPKEASLLDPNQRLFLETAWCAIEDAGMGGRRLAGSRTGVYVGYGSDSEYKRMIDQAEPESASMAMPGNVKPIIASRLSYLLDLRGPSLLVDTTCSSSLVAVHLACQALRSGECEQAIAGGIQLHLLPVREFEVGIESSTARTRTFDDAADGTGTGEGAVAIVLKPLSQALRDRDPVYAVIKGSAVNQDGSSVGITAPNADAQADVISEAWRQASIDPETIGYIETHGTGTRLGDPIEVEGIRRAFSRYTNRKMFCAVGSIKSNLGHLDNAAGIAGLLKTVLALKHRQLFPTLHIERPNRTIPFVLSPVYINTHLSAWEEGDTPLRCGVSSFGISGTNCHVVLEEAPAAAKNEEEVPSEKVELLPLSARSEASLLLLARQYADFIDANPNMQLNELCYTASVSRGHYSYRIAIVASTLHDVSKKLRELSVEQLHGPTTPIIEANERADHVLNELLRNEDFYVHSIEEIGRLYEAGAEIRWEKLYERRYLARLNVPATPFEQQRCWLHWPDDAADVKGHATAPSRYHRLEWRKESVSNSLLVMEQPSTLIAGTDQTLIARAAARLRAAGRSMAAQEPSVYEAVLTNETTSRDDSNLSPISAYATQFDTFLRQVEGTAVQRIVVLLNEEEETDAEQRLDYGAWLVLGLLRALAAMDRQETVELILAAAGVYRVDGNEACTNPSAAALFALGKSIQWEMPYIRVRTVDYGYCTDDVDGLTAALTREADDGAPYSSAWRSGQRYVEKVSVLHYNPADQPEFVWRSEGVYLITGGLGSVGLRIAQRIAAKGAVRIVLMNRTEFPPREVWDYILSDDPNSDAAHRIQTIREIEWTGTRIEIIRADVSDERSLREAVRLLRQRWGRINGIVHAAGNLSGEYLVKVTESDFDSFTAAKIRGTRLLDELTRSDSPDFLILFSSAITLIGGVGSGPYTAANAWLDHYAAARCAEGARIFSIGWPTWEQAVLTADPEADERKELFRILRTNDGLDAFEQLLHMDAPHVITGEWNRESALFTLSERLPFRIDTVPTERVTQSIHKLSNSSKRNKPVKLRGKIEGASYSEVEQKVAQAWMAVLGYEELGIDDNFFDLGGDSILITRLHERLQEEFPGQTKIADLFSHPTIAKQSAFLTDKGLIDEAKDVTDKQSDSNTKVSTDIAIIGMSVRLPDAPDLETFWANLIGSKESIRAYPENRQADGRRFISHFTDVPDTDVRFSYGGYLERVDEFDPEFFGISPREAALMDPNQRLFLEACWEAIEDAGYGGGKISGTQTGVYLGYADWPVYGQYITKKHPSLIHAAGAGNTPSLIASRISYLLDLQGPAFLVDTACSSSLVAVHLACQAIRSGECDMAIAGGVKTCLMPIEGVFEIGIESSQYRTRAFDDSSDGTVWGEGTVAILLKPLEQAMEDGDRIYAVIKGSAMNQDGASAGITAPNAAAQEKVIAQAWENAAINPSTITYIETHGTATKLGDPIEVDGIQRAFERYTDKKQFCAISSVKSNIGHLDSAAGIAGLAKAVASLLYGQLAPTLHFERPNRNIAFAQSPVYVVDRPQTWETEDGMPRRCGVSSFGFSGTNCHIVLEEAPKRIERSSPASEESEGWRILTLSGKSESALQALVTRYQVFLSESVDSIDEICVTANIGRGHYAYRAAFVFYSRRELLEQLQQFERLTASSTQVTHDPPNIFRGYHKIVTGDRNTETDGLITAAKHRQLSEAASTLLDSVGSFSKIGAESLFELARLYISGAEVDWMKLYSHSHTQIRKVRVPVYPFQRRRCWIESDTHSNPTEAVSTMKASTSQLSNPMPVNIVLKGASSDYIDPLLDSLGQLWGRLLGLSELSVDDDFFELGGHSLLAIELERELARLNIDIDADELYQYRSLAALASHIRKTCGEAAIDIPSLETRTLVQSPNVQATTLSTPAQSISQERQETFEPTNGKVLAETLILPNIEPFNDIFYRNCFYNSMFPVIRSFGRSIAPFLANDLILYEENNGHFAVRYDAIQQMEVLFTNNNIRAELRYGSSDIVNELLVSLSSGQPAVVWVDCYELSIRQDAFGKRHIDHTLLVFGYDRRERLFHVVEHDRLENLSYRRRTLPFTDLANAFDSFVERYVRTGEHEVTHYLFEPMSNDSASTIDPVIQWARCWHKGRLLLQESLSALSRIQADYIRLTAEDNSLRPHVDRFIAFLNDATAAKRVELYRLHTLLPEAKEEQALLNSILTDWEYVRKGMARYMYGDVYRSEVFESGADRLTQIAEKELKLQQMITAQLDAIAERAIN